VNRAQHMDWCDPECDPDMAEGSRHTGIAISVGRGAMTTFLTQAPRDGELPWLALCPRAQPGGNVTMVHGPIVPGLALAVAQHAGRLMLIGGTGDESRAAFVERLTRAFLAGLITGQSPYRQKLDESEGD
jgi:hypothetical protein